MADAWQSQQLERHIVGGLHGEAPITAPTRGAGRLRGAAHCDDEGCGAHVSAKSAPPSCRASRRGPHAKYPPRRRIRVGETAADNRGDEEADEPLLPHGCSAARRASARLHWARRSVAPRVRAAGALEPRGGHETAPQGWPTSRQHSPTPRQQLANAGEPPGKRPRRSWRQPRPRKRVIRLESNRHGCGDNHV